MLEWYLQKIDMKRLRPHPHNPRKMTKEQYSHLKKSLEKFGLIDKPIVTKIEGCEDFQVIAGHQRLKILKEIGQKEVECSICTVILSQQDIDELLIRHNKNTGEWDWDELANSFDVVDLFESGFTADELHLESEDNPKDKKDKKKQTCPECGHQF